MTGMSHKTIRDLEEENQFLQAKLNLIEQKKKILLEDEGAIRTEMQRLENQIYRLKQLNTTPE